ncbi:hypothetical protein M2146_002548 [Lachnospiraceae bacterium PF1-22]
MRVRFTYKQKFGEEILKDSYIKTVSNRREIREAEERLYSDPHVFEVESKIIEK